MTGALLQSLVTGLLAGDPITAIGLIPVSFAAATDRPRNAWPYAVFGMCAIVLFSPLAWLLHAGLAAARLLPLEVPGAVLLLWGVRRTLALAFRRVPALADQSPFFFANCAVLGTGLLTAGRSPGQPAAALGHAAGAAAAFFVATVTIAHLRSRIETGRAPRLLAGWPSLLLACAVLWIVFQGLALLVR
ncbi:MAG: hypothetical protein MUF78_04850 [Candidatus Edwardsbacteria bacterium]|nr:hypothetical protein [Candidatus Edwardsbacteria bacterium]